MSVTAIPFSYYEDTCIYDSFTSQIVTISIKREKGYLILKSKDTWNEYVPLEGGGGNSNNELSRKAEILPKIQR